ncbi:MAG TPA: TraB/GumN family protein, partial [Lysobacter sp.]
ADARQVVFEVSPDEFDSPDVAMQTLQLARFENGAQLSAVLPDATRAALDAALRARGASLAQLDPFEPWFVTLSLVMELAQSAGFRGDDGLDQHLMRKARAAGKPVAGLETVQSQLLALDSTPMHEQIAGLAELIERPAEMQAAVEGLHAAWRAGDAVKLEALSRSEMQAKTPETYRIINVERNRAWLPQLRGMLDGPDTDDVLVVVGAMHLLGPDGLVEQLRGNGYRIERICDACAGR